MESPSDQGTWKIALKIVLKLCQKDKNLILSAELVRQISYCKEIRKLMF